MAEGKNSTSMAFGELTSECALYHLLTQLTVLCSYGLDAKGLGQTQLNLTENLIGGPIYQSGALVSFAGNPESITMRVGVSYVSKEQACQNAEEEVGEASFDEIVQRAKGLWNDRLKKVEIDIANTPANITEMLYSSLYRASLTPVRPFSLA